MTPSDIRLLIHSASLSTREAASEVGINERLLRRMQDGSEDIRPDTAAKLTELAADRLAAQLMRSLEIAAGGRVEIARLTVRPDSIALDGIESFSQITQLSLRSAFIARLMQRGLKIERGDD